MLANVWRSLGRVAIGGCAALLLVTGSAQAQDSSDLKARLEKLERDNAELKRIIQEGSLTQTQAEGGAPKDQVEKIVKDYLDKKKKDDDTKKKTDDEAKKKKDEEEGFEVGKDLTFKSTFKDGLYFETGDKAFKAAIRGRWHQYWGWGEADFPNPASPVPFVPPLVPNDPRHPTILNATRDLDDGTIFRRGRLGMQGTLYEVHDFVAEFEFAGGSVAFREVWMGLNQLPFVGTLRIGHMKGPFSLEELTSSRYLTFIERAIPVGDPVGDNLSYNSGAMLTNTYMDERGTWAAGVFRQTDATGNDAGDGDYQYTGRVTFLPVWENNGRCLVHVGAAGSLRQPPGPGGPGRDVTNTSGFIQDTAQFRARPYRVDPIAFVDTGALYMESYNVVGLEFAAVWGPLSIQAEYQMWNLENVQYFDPVAPISANRKFTDQSYTGYYVFASYFLTGENRAYSRTSGAFSRVRPHTNTWLVETGDDCCKGSCFGSGAWEIAIRYAHLDTSDGVLGTPGVVGVIPTTGQVDQYTLGLNWYWNPNTKVQWNYEVFNMDRTGSTLVNANVNDGTVQTFVMAFCWDF